MPSIVACSEQQFVDCDPNNSGCDGGWMTRAWSYLQGTSGLMKLSDYPYTSGASGAVSAIPVDCRFDSFLIVINNNYLQNGASCLYDASKAVAEVASYATIPAGSSAVAAIKQALTTYGPVPVAIDASNDWSAYK